CPAAVKPNGEGKRRAAMQIASARLSHITPRQRCERTVKIHLPGQSGCQRLPISYSKYVRNESLATTRSDGHGHARPKGKGCVRQDHAAVAGPVDARQAVRPLYR